MRVRAPAQARLTAVVKAEPAWLNTNRGAAYVYSGADGALLFRI